MSTWSYGTSGTTTASPNTVSIDREKCWTIIKVPGHDPKITGRSVAHIGDIKVKARIQNGVAEARFRHRFNSGAPHNYPEGLETAIQAWLQGWGYAGLGLNQYLTKLFGKKIKRTI